MRLKSFYKIMYQYQHHGNMFVIHYRYEYTLYSTIRITHMRLSGSSSSRFRLVHIEAGLQNVILWQLLIRLVNGSQRWTWGKEKYIGIHAVLLFICPYKLSLVNSSFSYISIVWISHRKHTKISKICYFHILQKLSIWVFLFSSNFIYRTLYYIFPIQCTAGHKYITQFPL